MERKNLSHYLLHGGIAGRWFEDRTYDPNNPFYRVNNTRVQSGDTKIDVLDRTVYPSGEIASNALALHYDDLEACPEDVAQFQKGVETQAMRLSSPELSPKVQPKKDIARINIPKFSQHSPSMSNHTL